MLPAVRTYAQCVTGVRNIVDVLSVVSHSFHHWRVMQGSYVLIAWIWVVAGEQPLGNVSMCGILLSPIYTRL